MATTAAAIPRTTAPRRLYVGLAVLATLIAAVGFWPAYFGPLVAGTADKTLIIHFHAAIYVGWLAIFATQALLAATGRVASHIKLGRFAIGYGVVVIAVGLITAFARFAVRVRAGEVTAAQAQLLGPLLDMLVFAPLFAAAVYYRRTPQLHKRLMIVATTSLLIAAVSRMEFLGSPRNQLLLHLIWAAPILLAMAHDFWRQHKGSYGLRAWSRRASARRTPRPHARAPVAAMARHESLARDLGGLTMPRRWPVALDKGAPRNLSICRGETRMHRRSFAALSAAAVLLAPPAASAEEILLLSSVGIKAVVEELAPSFEKATTNEVTATFGLASALKTRIEGGERFDVAILTPALLDELIAKGLVAADSRTIVARVGLGLMIKAGAPKPQVGTVDEFKRTLVAARSVTYASSGASGVAFLKILDDLGIAAEVKAKAKPAASGEEVNANVLGGASDLAVLPVSEILPVAGAELGALFPDPVQTYVLMAAGVSTAARGRAPNDFVAFLTAPNNDGVVRAKGMERVR